MPRKISEYFLYQHRYAFGHLFITTTIFVMLVVAWLFVPGGLRVEELASSVQSGNLSLQHFQPQMIIDLPYHLLQRASFALLGVTTISIKLPSLILGIGTIVGLYIVLRHWFRESVTIPSVLIMVTMPLFLFMTQDGTPPIYFQFISIWILVLATFISWRRGPVMVWKILLCVAMGLACYTPLGIYLPLTLAIMGIAHPRVRTVIRRLSKPKLAAGIALGLAAIAPIIYASVHDRDVALTLLGIPTSRPDLQANIMAGVNQLFGFWEPLDGSILTPYYSFGMMALMLIGLYRLTQVRYTARSYVTWIWLLLLIPFVILSPEYLYVLYILAALFVLRGLSQLLVHGWYRIFPRNAYARIAGMVPVAILVLALMLSSVFRYVYSYTYSPPLVQSFSKDLQLLDREFAKYHYTQVALVATPEEADFYRLAARYNSQYRVVVSPEQASAAKTTIMTQASHREHDVTRSPTKIITNSLYAHSDRFYIYSDATE